MKDNRIYRKLENLIWMAIISVSFIACTDDDIVKNFTPRKGEMMTEYLTTRGDDFSLFVEMLGRTKLNTTPMLDLLSTYGSYTCFAPDNDAILDYLGSIDLESVSSLTDEECEEIVFTHIIEKKAYFTTDMNDGALPSTNLSDRFLTVSCSTDSIGTLSYNINKNSRIIARDDSVSNGVVHKIDKILILSSDMLPDVLTADSSITLFNEALKITGIKDSLYKYIDLNYSCGIDSVETGVYYHTGNEWERAYYLKQRKFMFTVFAEPDSIYQMNGINNINELTAFAKRVYDRTYPQDAGLYDEDPTHRKNPLNRFVSYHILDRLANYNDLTITGDIKEKMQVTTVMDATDIYETMCPFTIIQCSSPSAGMFINRKGVGDSYTHRGVRILSPSEVEHDQQATNGVYHYIDDILVYDVATRDEVFNCRFRIDATTLSPDFMSSGARGREGTDECTGFKNGFTKHWWFTNETMVSVRNRHTEFDSYQGDEIVLLGQYDFKVKLPPVPEGTYEIRLGYCAMGTRGIIQVFINKEPCGIPLDLRVFAADASIGWVADTNDEEENRANDKALKNRGYMKGPDSVKKYWAGSYHIFRNQAQTFRRILTTQYLSDEEDYYLHIKQVLDNPKAEFAFDYLELCPKSVYGSEEGEDTH